jgi:hypothetical protein
MSKIIDAMGLVSELNKTHGVTQRGGKKYTQVVHRMEAFRTVFGLDCGVDTQILVDDGQRVVVKAVVTDDNGHIIGSGMAEEIRGQGNVNKTSALENCETSAVGRALASIGLSGGEYASANEMEAVPRKQQNLETSGSGGGSGGNPPSPVETSSDSQDDPHRAADVDVYNKARVKLENIKLLGGVHNLFAETKPQIAEIKGRNPARAKALVELFQKHEARLGG